MVKQKTPIRQLVRDIKVPASTIRFHLDYAKAADMRKSCAPETADEVIAKLTHKQVKYYTALPESLRDKWLDAGADLDAFADDRGWPECRVTDEIRQYRLAEFLDTRDEFAFKGSVRYLVQLCVWCSLHSIEGIRDYLREVVEHGLPAKILELLPLELAGRKCRVLISSKAWGKALDQSVKHGGDDAGVLAMVESAVRVSLRDAGHDLADVCGPQVAESLQIVADGPEFIREADFLSLDEKRFLIEVDLGLDDEVATDAKRRAVDRLRDERCQIGDAKRSKRPKVTVKEVLDDCLEEMLSASTPNGDSITDPQQLFKAVVESLSDTDAIGHGTVNGRPATDVLAERLNEMEWPEFFLLAPGIMHAEDVEPIAAAWLNAMQEELAAEEA